MKSGSQIIKIAIRNGATLAGISSVKALKQSPSHMIYTQIEDYTGVGTIKDDNKLSNDKLFNWPDTAKSLLVIGLSHPKELPELDWWDGEGTPGNRQLISIMNRIQEQIENDLNIGTHKAAYYVEKGGVFLKDAAVLAGLGCIGKNNMLITREYGPKIRLRALFLKKEFESTGPVEFDPCSACKGFCRSICPEKAMLNKAPFLKLFDDFEYLPARDGFFDRKVCNIRMEKNIHESREINSIKKAPVKYCRRCEFVCPVG
jgi:epoxyqueuosine reductase